jgi:hypothetical protein
MHTWALWHILIHIFVLAAFICGDRAEQEPERGGAGRAALWPLLSGLRLEMRPLHTTALHRDPPRPWDPSPSRPGVAERSPPYVLTSTPPV